MNVGPSVSLDLRSPRIPGEGHMLIYNASQKVWTRTDLLSSILNYIDGVDYEACVLNSLQKN